MHHEDLQRERMGERMKQPNVLYLHSHDTGRHIAPYGYAVETPRLQRLAGEGVIFRQAFSAASTCSPSRAALLTGQYPHANGMLGLAHRGFALWNPERHIAQTLGRAGYHTVLAGFQHVATEENLPTLGYDEAPNNPLRAEQIARDFLQSASPDTPFFLDVGFIETHRVGRSFGESEAEEPTIEEAARYCHPPMPLPDLPTIRRDLAAYQAAAARLDTKTGVVLDALEDAGLSEDTLVIYTTDHGIPFPRMKCNLTDHGTGVSLIMRGPASFTGGRVIDALVSHLDLYPTIAELAGIDDSDWLQGKSLMPLIRDETSQIHGAIFAEITFHAAYEPQRAVRTKRWKYIRRWSEYRHPVLANVDDSPTKDALLGQGWSEHDLSDEALYDLTFDPSEANNLASDPKRADTLAEMRDRLERWMRETDDPLLTGEIPVPAGAQLNAADDQSPNDPTMSWDDIRAR